MQFPTFTVPGLVSELRELTSQKNKDWRGYRCKVATTGASLELVVTPDQFKQLGVGQHLIFKGRIEQGGSNISLITDHFKPAPGIESAPAPAAKS